MRKQNFRVKKINFQLNMLWIKKVFVFFAMSKSNNPVMDGGLDTT